MMRKYVFSCLVAAAACVAMTGTAQGYTFSLDKFSVVKNGNQIFSDSFGDGLVPPSAPDFSNGMPAEYLVQGAVGPEVASRLALDRDDTILATNAAGVPTLFQGAILATNIDESNLTVGLKSDDTLSITGIFDLILPLERRQSYGIRFTDRAVNLSLPGNDLPELRVVHTPGGQLLVQFIEADFEVGVINIIDSVLLDTAHDQIALTLTRGDLSSNAVTASFAYIDGGIVGASQRLAGSADIFEGENWTRAQLFARQVAPIRALPFVPLLLD